MIWYVAIVAILNLALGYAVATKLGAKRGQAAIAGANISESSESAER